MTARDPITRATAVLASVCLSAAAVLLVLGSQEPAGYLLVGFFLLLAVAVRGFPALRGFTFTFCVLAAVTLAMFHPTLIREVNGFDTSRLIVPLLQIIMFGMGTALSIGDFTRVIRMPKAVLVGLACQFSIMPLVGFTLAMSFGFPPEIAAGVVLIGSSPSGLASNVMTFLAKGNVALSVTLTAVATMMAPIMTPFLMQNLAGQFISVDVLAMMRSIFNMVIVPVVLGLAFNHLFRGRAVWLHRAMPLLSMAGIAVIITVITAAGRDHLMTIGIALVFAAVLHNAAGYFLGYWGCKLVRMDEQSCRTIALEVGMQNGGLASGIAAELGRAATLGLAPAVFGPWMNISGSVLANWWRDRPLEPTTAVTTPSATEQSTVDAGPTTGD